MSSKRLQRGTSYDTLLEPSYASPYLVDIPDLRLQSAQENQHSLTSQLFTEFHCTRVSLRSDLIEWFSSESNPPHNFFVRAHIQGTRVEVVTYQWVLNRATA